MVDVVNGLVFTIDIVFWLSFLKCLNCTCSRIWAHPPQSFPLLPMRWTNLLWVCWNTWYLSWSLQNLPSGTAPMGSHLPTPHSAMGICIQDLRHEPCVISGWCVIQMPTLLFPLPRGWINWCIFMEWVRIIITTQGYCVAEQKAPWKDETDCLHMTWEATSLSTNFHVFKWR